ncbi:hypothetical protein ACP275_01G068700 [Erythranthe tilingii]
MDAELHTEVARGDRDKPAEQTYMTIGSTAVVVLVGKQEVVVANCSGSRAVLCRGGVVLPMLTDHKVTIMRDCFCFLGSIF